MANNDKWTIGLKKPNGILHSMDKKETTKKVDREKEPIDDEKCLIKKAHEVKV